MAFSDPTLPTPAVPRSDQPARFAWLVVLALATLTLSANARAADDDVRARVDKSAHTGLECADCHDGAKDGAKPPVCTACHEDAVKDLAASVHGPKSSCSSCHGPIHDLPPSGDAASRTIKHAQAQTCGACHADPEFIRQHHTSVAHPVEAYGLSIHGRAVERGSDKAAACANCHGSHKILPARNPDSKVNRWNVPATCGACHTDIKNTYDASVHGAAVKAGMSGAPVCTDCHGEHAILAPGEPRSLVNPSRVSAVTCGRCHADERLAQKYNLPLDKVPAFEDSFHGMAMRSGSQTVANCASCHGVHNILKASDPLSSIHPDNLAKTCGTCHPGAGQRFAIGAVHVRASTEHEHPVVRSIRLFYLLVIPLTLGGMLLHNALDLFAKMRRPPLRIESDEQLPRMNREFRIAHYLTVVSFPLLVITGFALKYPTAFWAAPLLALEGEIALRGVVHRISGVVLVLSLLYHVVHLIRRPGDRIILRELLPSFRDARELLQLLAHNLGRRAEPPHFGKFSYAHKVEYWAYIWGSLVMVVTGFMLWFDNFTLSQFPKWVIDAAMAAHFYEAVLATLAILIWHGYMTVFDPDVYPMDKAWLTGTVPADRLREISPAYYRALVRARDRAAGTALAAGTPPDPSAPPVSEKEPVKTPKPEGDA